MWQRGAVEGAAEASDDSQKRLQNEAKTRGPAGPSQNLTPLPPDFLQAGDDTKNLPEAVEAASSSFQRAEKSGAGGESRRPAEAYTVQQFQRDLTQAIIAKNTVRFEKLLKKYKHSSLRSEIAGVTNCGPSRELHDGEGPGSPKAVVRGDDRSLVDQVVGHTSLSTLTHVAVMSKELDFVRLCLEFGSAVHSYENINGSTALTLALSMQPAVALEMLQRGRNIDVTRVDTQGRNLLFHAVSLRPDTPHWPQRLEFIQAVLARNSAVASVKDCFGFTPAAWALEHINFFISREECMKIVEVLKEADDANRKCGSLEVEHKFGENVEGAVDEEQLTENESGSKTALRSGSRFWDRARLFLQRPTTRCSFILALMFFHMIVYASDGADRGMRAQFRDAQWDFWFTAYNAIASWDSLSFLLGLTRFVCVFSGAILGAFLYYLVVHVLMGRVILRLPICGAQSITERAFLRKSFGNVYASLYEGASRGKYFALSLGCIIGIYFGAKIYNALLYRFWPGQFLWALISPTIVGLDSVTALRGFWAGALALDWYILVFVCDIMYQQGFLNIYLPHSTFSSFAGRINVVLRLGMSRLMETDIHTARLWLYWTSLSFGWALIALVFGLLECSAPAKLLFVDPVFPMEPLFFTPFFSGICIFLECGILCQEWTWPTFQEHPFLYFPGGVISTHHVWFLVFVLLIELSLDVRVITAHVEFVGEQVGGLTSREVALFAVALVPALLGLIWLFAVVVRSSLWWEKLGAAGRAVRLHSNNSRPPSGPAGGARRGDEEEALAVRLSRQLACAAQQKNVRARRRAPRDTTQREEKHSTAPFS